MIIYRVVQEHASIHGYSHMPRNAGLHLQYGVSCLTDARQNTVGFVFFFGCLMHILSFRRDAP